METNGSPQVTPKKSHELADTLGLLAIVLTLVTWAIVPTIWLKAIALLFAGSIAVYLAYRSHFTRNLGLQVKRALAGLVVVLIVVISGIQFREEWHSPLIKPATITGPSGGQHQQSESNPPATSKPQPPKVGLLKSRHQPIPTPASTSSTPSSASPVPVPAPPQSVDHGIINYAPNNGQQTVEDNRQYGVSRPLPNVVGLTIEPIPAVPSPSSLSNISEDELKRLTEEYGRLQVVEAGPIWNPGLSLRFFLDAPFSSPMFLVRCDHPCIATKVEISDGNSSVSLMSESSFYRTNDPKVVVFGYARPLTLMINKSATLTVRSQDDKPIHSATVEAFAQ